MPTGGVVGSMIDRANSVCTALAQNTVVVRNTRAGVLVYNPGRLVGSTNAAKARALAAQDPKQAKLTLVSSFRLARGCRLYIGMIACGASLFA